MKTIAKKLLAVCLAGTMLTSLTVPALAADSDSKVTKSGREVTFQDIGVTTSTDEATFYKTALEKNDVFTNWVTLAYQVFKSQEDSYWDHAGDGWDEDYGKDGNYIDFMHYMLKAQSRHIDEAGWFADENVAGYISSGLSVANSLKEVQRRAADDIACLPNRKLTGEDFLERHPMDALTDTDQLVLYSTVSTFDRYGRTEQVGYDSFTIAFYDFQLHVLDDSQQLSGTVSTDTSSSEDGFITVFENQERSDVTQSATLANSVTESVSSTITNSETYTFGQSFGINATLTEKIPLTAQMSVNITENLSYTQAMATAYSDTDSYSETTNKSSTVTATVPAHTKTSATQTKSTTKSTTTFNCPVGITFKVAIFSMCGTCYDDNAAVQQFNTAGYEQRSFITLFGGASDASDAGDSLYLRADQHKGETSYDQTYGCTKGTNDDGDVWCTALNWNTIVGYGTPGCGIDVGSLKSGADLISALDSCYPKSDTGASISVVADSITTVQGEAQPILPIASTYIPWQIDNDWSLDRTFDLSVGETLPISTYRVKAVDADGVPYYGFISTAGTWKIVDSTGAEATSDVAEMVYDSVTGSQTLKATGEGTTYVKYFIPEKYYKTYDGTYSTNASINSPAYKVVVSDADRATFDGTLTLTGSVQATVGEKLNLNGAEGITLTAVNAAGASVTPVVSWEAQETENISIGVDGVMLIDKAGTYHVRACMDGIYSGWVDVVAAEPQTTLVQYVCYHPFTDVSHGTWYEGAVEYVYQNDVMNGVKTTLFQPVNEVTRAQVAQVLYNLEGRPNTGTDNAFGDVSDDAWYAKAITWAADNGLANGVKADQFQPNDLVTREQLVAFISRYSQWKGLELPANGADLSQYQDAGQVSAWAKEHITQALKAGLIQGKSATKLVPQGTASRAELAQIFVNLLDR